MKTKDLFLSALCIEFSYHFSFEEFAGYKSMWKPTAYQAESSPIGSLPDTGLQNTRVPHLFLRAHSSQFCFRLPGTPGCPVLFPIQVLPLLYGVRLKSQILEKLFPVSSTLGPLPPLNSSDNYYLHSQFGNWPRSVVFPDLTSSYTFNSFSTGVGLTFPKSGNPMWAETKGDFRPRPWPSSLHIEDGCHYSTKWFYKTAKMLPAYHSHNYFKH